MKEGFGLGLFIVFVIALLAGGPAFCFYGIYEFNRGKRYAETRAVESGAAEFILKNGTIEGVTYKGCK